MSQEIASNELSELAPSTDDALPKERKRKKTSIDAPRSNLFLMEPDGLTLV